MLLLCLKGAREPIVDQSLVEVAPEDFAKLPENVLHHDVGLTSTDQRQGVDRVRPGRVSAVFVAMSVTVRG